MRLFQNRQQAGFVLAKELGAYRERSDVIVLGLPRGGVPVAYEVARYLEAPLDVVVVRKLGAPDHEELAIGAVASDGIRVLNKALVKALDITEEVIAAIERRELSEVTRREELYRI